MNSLEIRIPISPRADYFNRVRLLVLSIREMYPDAIAQVSVGSNEAAYDLYEALPWSKSLGIEWAWVPHDEFAAWGATAHAYMATMMQRFKAPFNAEFVLMLDADIIAMRRFDELFAIDDAVAGIMAHASPFASNHVETWQRLFRGYNLADPQFESQHSGWNTMVVDPTLRFSPPYFNTGVLFARATIYERLYSSYMDALAYVRRNMDSYFFEQIALTLATERLGIPMAVLPLRYNFPNQAAFDEQWRAELADIRFLHFLRTDIVDREKDFMSASTVARLLARNDLRGSNEFLRQRVACFAE